MQHSNYRIGGIILLIMASLIGGAAIAESQSEMMSAPSHEQLLRATNPGYVSPPQMHQECLGRLVFDLPHPMEWGVRAPGDFSGDHYRFTDAIKEGNETVDFGELSIMVSAPAKRSDIDRMLRKPKAEKSIGIQAYQSKIKTKKSIIEDLKKNENKEDPKQVSKAIEDYQKDIKDDEANIAAIQKYNYPIKIGLPDSLGYHAGSTLYAYLYRDGKAYTFMSTQTIGGPGFEERKNEFFAVINRFKSRKLYEIPKERGVCIPYGFIPDDGTTSFITRVAIRYADRPNVIYTIGTGVVGSSIQREPEPAEFKAATFAAVGTMGGPANEEVARRLIKRIDAHRVKIGALPAAQGGAAVNTSDPGQPIIPNYSVYTGYPGWEGSQVLPFITVHMRSFTRDQEPDLKTNSPPFDESMERLDALLKSIRLRPTTPPMPELFNHM
jgi:hypothetical protein